MRSRILDAPNLTEEEKIARQAFMSDQIITGACLAG